MTTPDAHARFERIARAVRPDSALLRYWPLAGGVSATVTALQIALPDGSMERLVVRQHGTRDLKRDSRIASIEFRLLQVLAKAGYPAPKPWMLDQSDIVLPAPYIVIEYVEGSTGLEDGNERSVAEQMADALTQLHRIGTAERELWFLPPLSDRVSDFLRHPAGDPGIVRIQRALAAHWPLERPNDPVLLHGDFWPGNIIWNDHQIASVIDWEDAMFGDPVFDVASARLELFWLHSADAMATFTDRYTSMTGIDLTHLPFWDVWVTLDPMINLSTWGYDAETEAKMRVKLGEFLERALGELAMQ